MTVTRDYLTVNQVPFNAEAEEAVLGSILIDPDCLAQVGCLVDPQDFFRDGNRAVYQAMLSLGSGGINQVTVAHELSRQGKLQECGGAGYLSDLVAHLPTSVHAKYYAEIVRDCACYRKAIDVGAKIVARGYQAKGTPTEVFSDCLQFLQETIPDQITDVIGPEEHRDRMLAMLNKRRDHTEEPVRFGFPGLDGFLMGMYGGDYVVIGGRPSMGKTELASHIARINCVKKGKVNGEWREIPHKNVFIASVEMTLEQLDERELAMWGISIPSLRKAEMDEAVWSRVWDAANVVVKRPTYYLQGKVTIDHIYQRASLLQKTHGVDLIIIDHLQLVKESAQFRNRSTIDRISYISATAKNMAMELNVPVIMVSQLNREPEKRDTKMPRLSDLRESGSIEQDADVVLLVCRPDVYDKDDEPGVCYVDVAKARQIGKRRKFKLKWREADHAYGEVAEEVEYEQGELE